MRKSIPRQVDKKSRVPEEEKGVWGSQGGDRGLEFSSKGKGQTFLTVFLQFSSVQLLSRVRLFATPWITARQASVHHQLPEFTQTHVHRVGDAIQPSHPLSSPSSPAFNLSWHQGLFKWVSFSHQVAKVLGFQLQNQSFQWTPRTDLL